MKFTLPSPEEIKMFAHLEYLYEKNKLVAPLVIRVTDATGQLTEYEFNPDSEEELNMFRISPRSPKLRLPITIRISDRKGGRVNAVLKDLAPLPEWMDITYPKSGKA